MGTVILATKDAQLQQIFSRQHRFTLEMYNPGILSQLKSAPDVVFVFDLATYSDLEEAVQKALLSYQVVLTAPPSEMSGQRPFPGNPNITTYFLEETELTRYQNLVIFVENLLERLVLSHRLNDYIKESFKDIVNTSLLQKQKLEIESLNEQLREISRIDYLTNLLNRRALLEAFEAEKRRALRSRWRLKKTGHMDLEHPLPEETDGPEDFHHEAKGQLKDHLGNFACLMIDIDHFKQVNDTYGHLMGDKVLKQFGDLLRTPGLFRDSDILGRYGGEEFIVLLPDTNSSYAEYPAERLREAMKGIVFTDSKKRKFTVTLSIGISEFLPEEASCEEMIKRADEALYYAKEHGRDQVVIYENLEKV